MTKKPPSGQAHYRAYLTDEQVRDMRRLRKEGHKYEYLAALFKATIGTVQNIITMRTRRDTR